MISRRPARSTVRTAALDLWPLLLAMLLCWPLLTGRGVPLARDLVFVPRQPFTQDAVGLGSTAPRAVPLDAVVSLLSTVIDGSILAKILVPGLLALAGCGVHRVLRGHGTAARLAAGGLAVWNPWTVERLSLGQWALIGGYAVLPFLAVAVTRYRVRGATSDLARTTLWAALASLTPTGGVFAVLTAATFGVSRRPKTWLPVAAAALLQAPWIVAGVVGAAGLTSDPEGVSAFAARADGAGHVLLTLLGLGGVWDARSVPASREAGWAVAMAALVLVVLVVGVWTLAARTPRTLILRTALLAVGGFVLAAASSFGVGEDLLRGLVQDVPGAGLLRDSQKFLAPFVVTVCVLFGAAVGAAARLLQRFGEGWGTTVVVVGMLAPLVLLPDATTRTWPTVTPVMIPEGFTHAAELVAADPSPQDCRIVSLPWRSYRGYGWGSGETSSDVALRLFDCSVIADDSLRVGSLLVRGENAVAHEVGQALMQGPPADVLAERGVGWILVQRDDPEVAKIDLTGLDEVYGDEVIGLYRVPGPEPFDQNLPISRQLLVWLAIVVSFVTVLLASAALVMARQRSRTARDPDTICGP